MGFSDFWWVRIALIETSGCEGRFIFSDLTLPLASWRRVELPNQLTLTCHHI